jgi:hypothetical protein
VEGAFQFPISACWYHGDWITHGQSELKDNLFSSVLHISDERNGQIFLWIQESPRWLASVNRKAEALQALAYLRKEDEDSDAVICEMAEIEAAIAEEREVQKSIGFGGYISKKGNAIRFFIAFWIFVLQQWSGQNSV